MGPNNVSSKDTKEIHFPCPIMGKSQIHQVPKGLSDEAIANLQVEELGL